VVCGCGVVLWWLLAQDGIQDARERKAEEAKRAAREAKRKAAADASAASGRGGSRGKGKKKEKGGDGGVVESLHRRLQSMTVEERLANARGRSKAGKHKKAKKSNHAGRNAFASELNAVLARRR